MTDSSIFSEIEGFCRLIIKKRVDPRDLESEVLAVLFLEYYDIPNPVSLEYLTRNAHRFGIKEINPHNLPGLSGTKIKHEDGYAISYNQAEWKHRIEHTILHEIREIIEDTFDVLVPGYVKLTGPALENKADKFAGCVLMPKERFYPKIFETGFDPVLLRRSESRSYSGILRRMKQLLEGNLPFIGVLYERMDYNGNTSEFQGTGKLSPIKLESTLTNTNGQQLKVRLSLKGFRYKKTKKRLDLLSINIPKRGSAITPGTLAEIVAREKSPVYLRRATGFDLFGFHDWSFIAQPVIWSGKLEKIVIVGLRSSDNHLLIPQLQRLNPMIIKETFQVI